MAPYRVGSGAGEGIRTLDINLGKVSARLCRLVILVGNLSFYGPDLAHLPVTNQGPINTP